MAVKRTVVSTATLATMAALGGLLPPSSAARSRCGFVRTASFLASGEQGSVVRRRLGGGLSRFTSTSSRGNDESDDSSSADFAGVSSSAPSRSNVSSRSKASRQADGTIVVGGGIAGLAAAAALRNIASVRNVRVLEQFPSPQFHDDRSGAGAQLGPNGLKALRSIGGENLLEKVMASGTKLQGNAVLLPTPPGPMTIPDTAEEETGLPQVLMRWGVLRSMLADLLPEESIVCGAGDNVAGYQPSAENGEEEEGVKLVAWDGGDIIVGETAGASSSSSSSSSFPEAAAPLIVAADGIYSTFRPLVNSAGEKTALSSESETKDGIKYNNRINIKAAVESELSGEEFQPGHTYSFFTPDGAVACFAGPAGEGFTYWAISILDSSSGDDDSGGNTDELIKLASSGDPDAIDPADLKSALLDKLRGLENPSCQFAIDKIEETDPKYIYTSPSEEAAEIGPTLISSDGRVVLVGDAAHAMSPSYGQGPNFALEDAASLAACVRDAAAEEGDEEGGLRSALEAYEACRLERCREMQRRSAERAARAAKGEPAEDVSKWIFQWEVPSAEGGGKKGQ